MQEQPEMKSEEKKPLNKRTQDFAFVYSNVKNKRAMDKESMTQALIGCGGADGIDLDKNQAHIELQERIAFE